MVFRKLSTLLFIAGSILALSSCKDDDEDATVAPSLKGKLEFQLAPYVTPDTKVTLTPEGVRHPEGKGVGYYWKVSDPKMTKADTTKYESDPDTFDGAFTYTFRDSLATYTISCSAFADGYGNSYTSKYVTVVKSGLNGSLTGTGFTSTDSKKFTADGVDYYFVSHNGLDWMRNNLANPKYGVAYMGTDVMSDIFGRYYSFEDASKEDICPEGWRLPTDKEWRELANAVNGKGLAGDYATIPAIAADFMADAEFNGEKMWEYWPEVGDIRNSGKISMIPAGYANLGTKDQSGRYPTASFRGKGEYAIFWTSDRVADEDGMAYYRYLTVDQSDMSVGKGDIETFGANIRCVRSSASANQ